MKGFNRCINAKWPPGGAKESNINNLQIKLSKFVKKSGKTFSFQRNMTEKKDFNYCESK